MSDIAQKPIKNIEDAKNYFKAMGCSAFHISREDFDRRDEYYALKISNETEADWRREAIEDLFENYGNDLEPDERWLHYSYLSDLVISQGDRANREDFSRLIDLAKGFIGSPYPQNIHIVLNDIVGNNGTSAHGGLIEKCYHLGYKDFMLGFIETAKLLMDESSDIEFTRGYFCDIIKALGIKEDPEYLKLLQKQDDEASFRYYSVGANEGNVFSMRMLARCYVEGKGCSKSNIDAIFWLKKAAASGNKLAQDELAALKE